LPVYAAVAIQQIHMKAILGQKIGMTQLWNDKGRLIAATVIRAEPNAVIRTKDRTQLAVAVKGKTNKPQQKLAEITGSKKGVWLSSVSEIAGEDATVTVEQFSVGEKLRITGITKGKGFAGGMKRHGFHGGPMSHGGDNHRGPGSIGAQRPQRVPKGQKMAGHMGSVQLTVRGSKVLSILAPENLLVVSGAVPGPKRGRVRVEVWG